MTGHISGRETGAADAIGLFRRLLPRPFGVTEGDLRKFVSACVLQQIPKKGIVRAASGIAMGIVSAGCLRVYFNEADGSDRVLYFAPEGWALPGLLAADGPASLCVEALEPTDVWLVPDVATLRHQSRALERVWNAVVESTLLRVQGRLLGGLRKDPAQRYVDFRSLYPGLERRIAQYHIAAYLGVTPEFFSRLKKRVLRMPPSDS